MASVRDMEKERVTHEGQKRRLCVTKRRRESRTGGKKRHLYVTSYTVGRKRWTKQEEPDEDVDDWRKRQ